MNHHDKTHALTALLAITLAFANHGVQAADETTGEEIIVTTQAEETVVTADASGSDTLQTAETETVTSQGAVVDKLSGEFAEFLGGEDQARELIGSLRENGLQAPELEAPVEEPLTEQPVASEPLPTDAPSEPLAAEDTSSTPTETVETTATDTATAEPELAEAETTDTAATEPLTTEVVATEPAKQLGYGEIRHTLKLAQAELLKLEIDQPSESELYAMLYGGDINGASVDGILAMRADGMGWGQIAHSYGFKLGELYGKGHQHQAAAAATTASTSTTSSGRMSGYIPSGSATSGHAYGRGLVSAGGGSVTTTLKGGNGGKAHGHTGAGAGGQVSSGVGHGGLGNGLASAGASAGQGQGLAKGHFKQ